MPGGERFTPRPVASRTVPICQSELPGQVGGREILSVTRVARVAFGGLFTPVVRVS